MVFSEYYKRIREAGLQHKPYAEWNGRVFHMKDIEYGSMRNPLFYYDDLVNQETTP